MKEKKYVYAGNRSTVLRRMIELSLNVTAILPTEGSHLDREASTFAVTSSRVSSKEELADYLVSSEFDIFVSTGCKFILPISLIKQHKPNALFVNIHPSFLPDLRGADPIPGAVFHRRDSGVTCHHMDDGIDTGPIIARKLIKYCHALDSRLLYLLCFRLEPEIFEKALRKKFLPLTKLVKQNVRPIYYSFKQGDNNFSISDTAVQLVARVKAFNTASKGFRFSVNHVNYVAFGAELLANTLVLSSSCRPNHHQWCVSGVFHDEIIVGNGKNTVRLSGVRPQPTEDLKGLPLSTPFV